MPTSAPEQIRNRAYALAYQQHGNPISDEDHFIGRADVMRKMLRTLRNPHASAVRETGGRCCYHHDWRLC